MTLTVQEYSDRLQQLFGLQDEIANYTIVPAGAQMLADIKRRILSQGKGTEGNQIGSYSTEPIYAGKDAFIKKGAFQARGIKMNIGDRLIPTQRTKTNSLKKNPVNYNTYTIARPDYKPRKTMYLPDGYKELRQIQGMEVGYMNLKYSGTMIKDFQMQRVAQTVLLGMTTERSSKVYQGLTKRFGAFFQPSQSEIQQFGATTASTISRLIRNTIEGQTLTANIQVNNVTAGT